MISLYNKSKLKVLFVLFQIYIGPARAVRENRDVVKEIKTGMLMAVDGGKGFVPRVGTVKAIPPNANAESQFSVHLMEPERAPYKPKFNG